MIELTRLNGNPLYVNCDLIKWAEAAPDTLLTLVNGEKIVVRESCEQLVERVHKHRLALLAELMKLIPEPEGLLRAASAASVPGPWSRAARESSNEGRHPHALDSEDDAETG
jgi:flagellar protein FlbD